MTITGYSYEPNYAEKWFVWECRCCRFADRWFIGTTEEFLEHISVHLQLKQYGIPGIGRDA